MILKVHFDFDSLCFHNVEGFSLVMSLFKPDEVSGTQSWDIVIYSIYRMLSR